MLKKSHYYAQNFSPDHSFFLPKSTIAWYAYMDMNDYFSNINYKYSF